MQPRFPADHHFYRRGRRSATRSDQPAADGLAALSDRALEYLTRQCLPAGDPSDPRWTP